MTKTIGYVTKVDYMKLTSFLFKIQKLIVVDTKTTAIIRKVTVYSAVFIFFEITRSLLVQFPYQVCLYFYNLFVNYFFPKHYVS